jgi:hypothetical protein
MSWASENKFLTGFGVVLLAGVGTLGYLTYSAMGKYETASGEFESAGGELKRLQGVKPFPDDKNLKDLIAQKQTLADKLAGLQTELQGRTLKVEPMPKEKFQDLLKATVAKIMAKAPEVKVTFPEGFYMDCAKYQTTPPEDAAAPVLARQLRAMELVVQVLLNAGGIEVKELKRELVPEEKGGAKAPAPRPVPGKGRPGQPADRDTPQRKLIEKTGFRITFTAPDAVLRQVLNNIVASKDQLFIVRRLELKNSAPEPPPKITGLAFTPAAPAAPEAPPSPDAPAAPAASPGAPPVVADVAIPGTTPTTGSPEQAPRQQGSLEYKFGTEKVEAVLEIDLLDFAGPEVLQAKGDKKKDK